MLDSALLLPDGHTVVVTLVGAPAPSDNRPCSAVYGIDESVADHVLIVSPWVQDERNLTACQLDELICCDHRFTIDVGAPFSVAKLRTGDQTMLFTRPAGLVELATVPAGWRLDSEGSEWNPTGIWKRTYVAPFAPPYETAKGHLELSQIFGGRPATEPDRLVRQLLINGTAANLYTWPDENAIKLDWSVGPDSVSLLANDGDFTGDELIDMARKAVPASP